MRQKERSDRNIRVVLMCMRQVPRKEVAEAFGVTERQVRRIMSDWREGSIKEETELAVDAVEKALKEIQDDMVALGIKAANAEPREQISLHVMRIELMTRSFSILRDAGVSFAGVFDGDYKDIDLVRDVNVAIRTSLEEEEIELEVIMATIGSVWQVFLDWDFRLP